MDINAANWVGEYTVTTGTGQITLAGAIRGFARFNVMGDGQVYYVIQDGIIKETGLGTLTGDVLERTLIHATIDDRGVYSRTPTPISLSGNAQVYGIVNAEFMQQLYNSSQQVFDAVQTVVDTAAAAAQSASDANQSAINSDASATSAQASSDNAASSEQVTADNTASVVGMTAEVNAALQLVLSASASIAGAYSYPWYYSPDTNGQTTIALPIDMDVSAVAEIYINGLHQDVGKHFTYDNVNKIIKDLSQPINIGDEVTVMVSGVGSGTGNSFQDLLKSDAGAGEIGTVGGKTVQERLNALHVLLTPKAYGAVGDGIADDTVALKACIADAVARRMPMAMTGCRCKVSATIDFTGVFYIESDTYSSIIVDPTNFTHKDPAQPYAVTFGDPSVDFRTNRMGAVALLGQLRVDSLNRNAVMHGVFIKGALMDFGSLRIVNFNGEGFTASAAWDSTFKSISVELCGNVDSFAFNVKTGGDTSNCISMARVQVERSYQKCFNVNAIRSNINTIHAERTAIISDNDGTAGLPTGVNYATFRLVVGNSTVNQIIHDAITTGAAPDGTPLAATRSSAVINADYSSIRDVGMGAGYVASTFGRNSSYDEIVAYDWAFDSANFTNNNIRGMRVINKLKAANRNTFVSGTVESVEPVFNAGDLLFDAIEINNIAFNANIQGNIHFRKCKFPETFTLGDCKSPAGSISQVMASGDKSPVTFEECEFLGTVAGAFQSRALFLGGFVNNVNLVSSAGFKFKGVKGNTWNHNGDRGYTTENCEFKTVAAWSTPSHMYYPIGTMTHRMGAVPAGGSALFVVTAVDATTNVSTWSPIAVKADIQPTPGTPIETSAGTAGMMQYDANNLYVCIGTNSWKKIALSAI